MSSEVTAKDVKRLKDLSKNDATVSAFFNTFKEGDDFNAMVLNLAVQLVNDKADLRSKLRKVIKGKENPTIFGLGIKE